MCFAGAEDFGVAFLVLQAFQGFWPPFFNEKSSTSCGCGGPTWCFWAFRDMFWWSFRGQGPFFTDSRRSRTAPPINVSFNLHIFLFGRCVWFLSWWFPKGCCVFHSSLKFAAKSQNCFKVNTPSFKRCSRRHPSAWAESGCRCSKSTKSQRRNRHVHIFIYHTFILIYVTYTFLHIISGSKKIETVTDSCLPKFC